MESTLSATTTTISTISKTLNSNSNPFLSHLLHRQFSTTRPTHLLQNQLALLRFRQTVNAHFHRFSRYSSVSHSSLNAYAGSRPVRCRLPCVSSSAASFASGGGGGGIGGSNTGGDGSGGGDGAADGGEVKANPVLGGADDFSATSSDVIILDVGGMTCGGCAASVKRILESQPQVSSATVNLTTETAVVWPISEAKVAPNWQKKLGDELAKHLSTCGFTSNLRGEAASEGKIPS